MEEDTGQETLSPQLGGGPPVDLIEESSLTYFIPQATSFNLEETFANVEGPHEEVFKSIEQRESLFFGRSARSATHLLSTSLSSPP